MSSQSIRLYFRLSDVSEWHFFPSKSSSCVPDGLWSAYPSLTFTLASSASSQRSVPSKRLRSGRRPRPGGRPRWWWVTWGHSLTPCPSSPNWSPQNPPPAAKAEKTKCKVQGDRILLCCILHDPIMSIYITFHHYGWYSIWVVEWMDDADKIPWCK